MADFPQQSQDYDRVTISTAHAESVGSEIRAANVGVAGSVTWPASNRALFVPFVVGAPLLVARLFVTNGSAVSGNVDVGIYDSGANRVSSAGSTAQAGTSALQFFDVTDVTLFPGVYYFAVALDNTTGALNAWAPVLGLTSAMGVLSQSSAFALPSTATFAAAQDAFVPAVGLTGRTV